MNTDGDTPEAGTSADADTAADWRAEAEKWKTSARDHEKAAKENAGAVEQLRRLEGDLQTVQSDADAKVKEAEADTAQQVEQARVEGEKSAADWRAEAEKWRALSDKHEDRAKENFAAAARVQQLEADKAASEQTAGDATAEAERLAATAEAKALRLEVASEYRLPTELAQFLTGTTKRDLEEQADRLISTIGQSKPPDTDSDDKTDEADREAAKKSDELAEAQRRAAEAEVRALRFEVAAEKGLPPQLADFLSAETKDELDKQADLLLQAAGQPDAGAASTRARMPSRNLRPGSLPEEGYEPEPDPTALAKQIRRNRRGY